MFYIKKISFILFFTLLSAISQADNALKTTSQFGEYTVHYSTFSSTFIKPDVAEAYKLTRAKNQTLINVSITRTANSKTSFGLSAEITGTATNLIQQQYNLKFIEIRENNAVYYIASLPHTNEEVFHFTINITPEGLKSSHSVSFSKKLYRGE